MPHSRCVLVAVALILSLPTRGFSQATASIAGVVRDPSGAVGFAWQEREPFAATLWIPQRFSALDAEGEVPVRERVRLFLERYRAAGVHLYCRYADDRWSLGAGLLRDLDSTDPRGTVVVGTRLSPADTTT